MYCVLHKTTEHVAGDQRSIDCPGHGYGAHTVERNEVIEFKDYNAFLEWVNLQERLSYGKKEYRAYKCQRLTIRKNITVDVT